MIDFTKLASANYFLDKNPGGDFLFGYGLLLFFIFILFIGSITKKIGPKNKYFKKSVRKQFGKFIVLGVCGLILVLSRFSAVPFFSMRLFLYFVFLLSLILLITTFFSIAKMYKKRLNSVEREKTK